MRKNAALLALLALALPGAAHASSVEAVNISSVVSGEISGFTRNGFAISSKGTVSVPARAINTGSGLFKDKADLASGEITVTMSTPEPGILSLFGTGLLGLAGYIRYRRSST